jgi:penicillin-binding protein 2
VLTPRRKQEAERTKLFTRRAVVLGGLQALLFGTLVGRLYQLQVVDSDRYAMLADENRINLQLLPPARGRIFDRFGQPIAANQVNYQLILIPEQTSGVRTTLQSLNQILPIDPAEAERILREARRNRSFMPITVRQNLNWDEVTRIEVNSPDLPGLMIDVGQARSYRFGERAAHIVGYVGAVSENELTDDPTLSLPGFKIGKNGMERSFESELRGKAGSRQVEVNAFGRVIRELTRDDGQPGDDLVLSVDMGLQEYVTARLEEESACCVVIDVINGEVLALGSTPSFDPNLFSRGVTHREWEAMIRNPRFPLTNKVIAGQYPPGSTFKPIVALAALEGKHMSPEERVFCTGKIHLGNVEFHCWKKGGHGSVNMLEGITKSCDVYFYEVARRVGVDNIAAMARRFGFGKPAGIDLPGEKAGLVPTEAWKRATYGIPWQKGETLVVGIGQGYMLSTPMQLAVMAARIGNGGIAVRPTLIRETFRDGERRPPERPAFPSLDLNPAHLALIQEGMIRVSNDPGGTAYRARIEEPEFALAGKTGSVQVRRISKAERDRGVIKNENRPWAERDHALFIGYAPYKSPRYAVSVVVEHGGGGAAVAAPIARDVLHEVQRRDPAGRTTEENARLLSALRSA